MGGGVKERDRGKGVGTISTAYAIMEPSLRGEERRGKYNVAPDYSICGVCLSIGRF
jgi:hypothetical protein